QVENARSRIEIAGAIKRAYGVDVARAVQNQGWNVFYLLVYGYALGPDHHAGWCILGNEDIVAVWFSQVESTGARIEIHGIVESAGQVDVAAGIGGYAAAEVIPRRPEVERCAENRGRGRAFLERLQARAISRARPSPLTSPYGHALFAPAKPIE